MENKLPNTIEKLLNKQRKIKYTSKSKIASVFISITLLVLIIIAVIVLLVIGGVI